MKVLYISNISKIVFDWEKVMSENKELKAENQNIGEQLNKITLDNNKSPSDNKNLIYENKKLTKKLLINVIIGI